jgi:flavonol synthase
MPDNLAAEVLTIYTLPVVDLAAAAEGRLAAGQLDAVRLGVEQVGILHVVNHGIPGGLAADFRDRVSRVLSLPRLRKEKLASPDGYPYRGWREWPDDSGRMEIERYTVGQFDTPADAAAAGVPARYCAPYANPNVWPADDPALRIVSFEYSEAARHVAQQALDLYARALGVATSGFALGTVPHIRLTVNNYPAWPHTDASDGEKVLLRQHSDDSMLTVLSQDGDYDGLQARLPDGAWLTVPAVPGAVQVLSGKLLTRLTNGRLQAVVHRVTAGGTMTRRSAAVFCSPSLETVIAPLADFLSGEEESKYDSLLIWDDVCRTGGP